MSASRSLPGTSRPVATLLWLALFLGALSWSAYQPRDYLTWWMEVSPALVGLMVLAATYRQFPLTPLAYWLILIHSVILMVGGHYTYALVPLFDWIRDWFGLARNNYDKLGHFAQGFVPAVIAREIMIRKQIVNGAAWRAFLIVCVCLAISVVYELIEWLAALVNGQAAAAFLGTQGYQWDTQSDMAWALVGAVVALVTVGAAHDRQLREITTAPGSA